MISWLKSFWRTKPSQTLAQMILSTRRNKARTSLLLVLIMVSTAINYALLIREVFQPADPANPAVYNLMTSEEFRQNTDPLFDKLKAYNREPSAERLDELSTLIVPDRGHIWVYVSLKFQLLPQADQAGNTLARYHYEPQITVRPALPGLLLFILIETILLLLLIYARLKEPAAMLAFEERQLARFFDDEPDAPAPSPLDTVRHLLHHFHRFCLALNHRHGGRAGLSVQHEYDVQDLLRALLKLHIADVRAEEPMPSCAGASARLDFLLHELEVGIEVKMTRAGLKDKKLGEELIVDIARYAEHPRCRQLICFVYDPSYLIRNRQALQEYVLRQGHRLPVELIFSPA
ncbi:PD-(D/E)XK nuclease domain-containing protein [Pseudomonas graminis]